MRKTLLLLAMLMAALCAAFPGEAELLIVATDFPCYDFVRQVAQEEAQVTLLIKPGTEVHTYDPSPADLLSISQADLFVYIGGESDAWVDRILSGLSESETPRLLKMMDVAELLEEEEDSAHDHEHHAHHDHEAEEHGEGEAYDEHIWTAPKNAVRMVDATAGALMDIDPDNAKTYRARADDYISRIMDIDAQLTVLTENASRNLLVFADRFPFLYLVRAYGLDHIAALAGCDAASEPSLQTIVTLIQEVEEEDIPAVYTIEMSSQSIARIVQEETGADILTLHSMQSVTRDEFEAGESYVSLMEKNVEALRRGLE